LKLVPKLKLNKTRLKKGRLLYFDLIFYRSIQLNFHYILTELFALTKKCNDFMQKPFIFVLQLKPF
jgi:hypothetical protein